MRQIGIIHKFRTLDDLSFQDERDKQQLVEQLGNKRKKSFYFPST